MSALQTGYDGNILKETTILCLVPTSMIANSFMLMKLLMQIRWSNK